jgi:hypothetical protein
VTELYDWNPMPHRLDVTCPACGKRAVFEFAEIVRIRPKDREYFKTSKLFDCRVFQDSCGHNWRGAVYYAGLHGGSSAELRHLPDGYKSEYWAHSPYLYRSHGLDIGAVRCNNCGVRRKHDLAWSDDAYFKVDYKGQRLWAFDRESAAELRDYIASPDRGLRHRTWKAFLRHVPTLFKERGTRQTVLKRLDRLLADAGQ